MPMESKAYVLGLHNELLNSVNSRIGLCLGLVYPVNH